MKERGMAWNVCPLCGSSDPARKYAPCDGSLVHLFHNQPEPEPTLWETAAAQEADLLAPSDDDGVTEVAMLAVDPREHARTSDPETSHAAARALGGKAGSMLRDLLEAYGTADLTAEEAAEERGYTAADGAWKRVSDLTNAGLVEPTGETRPASSGRQQRVLRITRLGVEVLRGEMP